jgi:hypothetical protein
VPHLVDGAPLSAGVLGAPPARELHPALERLPPAFGRPHYVIFTASRHGGAAAAAAAAAAKLGAVRGVVEAGGGHAVEVVVEGGAQLRELRRSVK